MLTGAGGGRVKALQARVFGSNLETLAAGKVRCERGRRPCSGDKYCLLRFHKWQPRQVIAYLELLTRAFLGCVTCTSSNAISVKLDTINSS
jgi:hypothetical protein